MKILAIGDFHGKFPGKLKKLVKNEKIDFIFSTGDFGGSDKLLKIIFKYFYENWWERVGEKKARKLIKDDYNSGKKIINELNNMKVPVYTVHGNWDFEDRTYKRRSAGFNIGKYSDIIKKKKNIVFLKKRIKNVKNLKVYGFGGFVVASVYLTNDGGFDKKQRDKYKKEHEKQKKQLFKKARKDIDILLAHYPPYGFFDKVKFKGQNPMNGKHVGFKPYLEFIKKFKPKLFICGHMHEYQGKKKIGDTLVVTTGSAKQGKAAVIEIASSKSKDFEASKIEKIKVKFVR
ncbi:hypothetical protein GF386_05490 [Candidatus Pacearchaeota archaeon]|nr:hypothetical protein [Candidatus Pacearchaeota archaeon]MBD3283553.1 hypothetical protein [Candidatus Pacearchaeota archaeon]